MSDLVRYSFPHQFVSISGQEQNLVVCTNDGKIIGVDLRAPSRIFKLSNDPSLGGVSAMCIDKNEHWICLGTR